MSAEELKKRYAELVSKRDELKTEKVRLESRLAVAKENQAKAMKELEDSFGVKTIEEAKELYQKKKEEIEAEINKCELELQF